MTKEKLNNEEWVTLEEDSRYAISNLGRVKRYAYTATWTSKDRCGYERTFHRECPEKIITNFLTGGSNGKYNGNKGKYLMVQLGAKGKILYIHRLVGKYFVPNPDNKPQINHIDENRLNNRADNLEWVTPQENSQHSAYKISEVTAGKPKTHSEEWHKEHDLYRNYVDKNKRIANGFANKNVSNRWALEYYADYLSKDEKRYLNEEILKNIQLKKKYNAKAKISYKEYINEA